MQYLFLMYCDEAHEMSEEEARHARATHWAVHEEANAKGVFRAASPLYPTSTAISVRPKNGSVAMTDGPFAETKEALGGFYLLECRDVEEAKYWAGRLALTGCATTVEIRQVAGMPTSATEEAVAEAVHV